MDERQELIDHMKKMVPEPPFMSAILDENKQVVPVHFIEAIFWQMEHEDALRVEKTQVGEYEVSTIFSVVPLNGYTTPRHIKTTHLPRATQEHLAKVAADFDEGDGPDWFETMVFGPTTYTFNRYRTFGEAQRGHHACVVDLQRKEL